MTKQTVQQMLAELTREGQAHGEKIGGSKTRQDTSSGRTLPANLMGRPNLSTEREWHDDGPRRRGKIADANYIPTSFRLHYSLRDGLNELAEVLGRDKGDLLNIAVATLLDRFTGPEETTQEGVAEAD